MKPQQTLLFILSIFLLLGTTALLTPKGGIHIGSFTFHMPLLSELLPSQTEEYVQIDEIIAASQLELDSILPQDTIPATLDSINVETQPLVHRASYDSLVAKIRKLEMNETGRQNLQRFFRHLESDTLVRIMHYGDSQIEGDRITSFLRNKLQVRYGGTGPGLRPAVQPYDYVFSAIQQNSSNWKRYPIYGKVDSTIEHRRYGVMGAFARFAPVRSDTLPFSDSILYKAELSISKSTVAYNRVKRYKHFRLFYGNNKKPVAIQLLAGIDTVYSDTLEAGKLYGMLSCPLPDTTESITLKFSGYDSPDIYGIELASTKGVIVDNIALRGCSGTIFTKADYGHSLQMYRDLNPALFILQFGGNTVPYLKDEKAVQRYGKWFGAQIRCLQSQCPDAAIIVIGPSDMSTKERDHYKTYELLPALVTEMKKVSLEHGAAFWDMFEAMGGMNSMPSWVNAQPALARPDYVHFSPRGARLVANMFYNALRIEMNQMHNDAKK